MNPNVQIILGYVLIAVCAIGAFGGSLMVKNGIDKKNKPAIMEQTIHNQEELQKNRKIAKIQINRIIEDAVFWLEKRIEQNKTDTEDIIHLFNKHNTLHGGDHILQHIKKVNNFIASVNEYVKEIDREIEDLLINTGEEKFGSIDWLKDEYQKYSDFIKRTKTTKDNIKQQNNELCLRFCDKPTFDIILKANSYKE